MDIFNVLSLVGGLSLFLFGMSLMGTALEKRAGNGLKNILARLTTGKVTGLLTGLGVTAVIQSSSATTVMVVGFVNSGLMTLKQAINVIMGANVGTTVTAWILSLSGINGSSIFVRLLKPSSFTPVLALIGIILYMSGKGGKRKDTGMILLGFATLMFGMEAMSTAVAGLREVPEFAQILLLFSNPVLGVLAGTLLTAIIQSSSASVGILQALASTGQITFGTAIPIIMGQNIGTCVTALLSSVGANKNAKRAAAVHLFFNIIGTVVWLSVFCLCNGMFHLPFIQEAADQFGIAVAHTVFNLLCLLLLLPCSGLLERLVCRLIPDGIHAEQNIELDERLMATPPIAIQRCRMISSEMAEHAVLAIDEAMGLLSAYDSHTALKIRELEEEGDRFEDELGSYLVKLSAHSMSSSDRAESAKLLRIIGDLERLSDHAVNVLESAEEIREKKISFSDDAMREMSVFTSAVHEVLSLSLRAFLADDAQSAGRVEPLEQVVDLLRPQLRARHVLRLQRGECSIEAGFVWSDLLTDLERVSDHCSNIAGCIIEMKHTDLDLHGYLDGVRAEDPAYQEAYRTYVQKYLLPEALTVSDIPAN